MARQKEIILRNREIARLRSEGARPKDLSERFGLKPSYIGEICEDVRREEEFMRSPDSLGPLSVRACHILSKAGVSSAASLIGFVRADPSWRDSLKGRHGASDKTIADIEGFMEKSIIPPKAEGT
jgi:hypothetical protein